MPRGAARRLARARRAERRVEEFFESESVELFRRHSQAISGCLGGQHLRQRAGRPFRLDQLAEIVDVDLDRRPRMLGAVVGPDLVDEPVDGHDVVRRQQQNAQDRSLLHSAERNG